MRLLIVSLFILTVLSSSANACVVAPGRQATNRVLQELINEADHVFIGQVERIIRRRWGPDDDMGRLERQWLKRKENGAKIHGYIQNRLDFSDATAYLKVRQPLKHTGISGRPKKRLRAFYDRGLVAIDMLSPYSVAGHGPCFSFPRTCPWDIKPGDTVAVAVVERRNGPWWATYCLRTDRLTLDTQADIHSRSLSATAAEMFWPFVEAERERARARWEAQQEK